MTDNNKILTVSYGTFSCTLEGFDDAVETMKAIAEYFRDLAADDRFFGAQPPHPEPGMLAQIAADQGAHRVEARAQDGRILLKAQSGMDPAGSTTQARTCAPDPAPAAQDRFGATGAGRDVDLSAAAFFANSPKPIALLAGTPQADDRPAGGAPDRAAPLPANSIAEKLQRIRSVAPHPDDAVFDDENRPLGDTGADMPFDMPDPAAATPDSPGDRVMTEAADDIAEALARDDDTALEDPAAGAEDDLDAVLSRLVADTREDKAPEETEADAPPASTDAPVSSGETGDEVLAPESDTDPQITADGMSVADSGDAPETGETAGADTVDTPSEDALRGRVLKVDRADLEAALEAGDLEEFEFDRPHSATPAGHADLPAMKDAEREDVSRLMAEADHQMEEPDGATRRSAFSHLRAAVAARVADKTMAQDDTAARQTQAYRSDLAQVVRPRRPATARDRTDTGSDQRLPPLKLVAEQRIEGPTTAAKNPASPAMTSGDGASDMSFADFAQRMEASDLSDRVEAAAAYLAHVSGHETFSRPQLMTLVEEAAGADVDREDVLRSFGQLVQAGKIEKVKGGRFTASDTIRFKPDERAAG